MISTSIFRYYFTIFKGKTPLKKLDQQGNHSRDRVGQGDFLKKRGRKTKEVGTKVLASQLSLDCRARRSG